MYSAGIHPPDLQASLTKAWLRKRRENPPAPQQAQPRQRLLPRAFAESEQVSMTHLNIQTQLDKSKTIRTVKVLNNYRKSIIFIHISQLDINHIIFEICIYYFY